MGYITSDSFNRQGQGFQDDRIPNCPDDLDQLLDNPSDPGGFNDTDDGSVPADSFNVQALLDEGSNARTRMRADNTRKD